MQKRSTLPAQRKSKSAGKLKKQEQLNSQKSLNENIVVHGGKGGTVF